MILNRIRSRVETELSEEQAGFRPNRGTQNHLCSLRVITERAWSYRQPLFMCFVDFEKAFDRVSHKKLWSEMLKMGFPRHLVHLIRNLYESQQSNVRAGRHHSVWFRVGKGVRQGCLLSPYLFNIMAEVLMRMALEGFEGGFRIGGLRITNLRYADDIVLIASSPEELQELVDRLCTAANRLSMKINIGKTEVMQICDSDEPLVVKINGTALKYSDAFKYLGCLFTDDAGASKEFDTRYAKAMTRMSELTKVWKSREISNNTKAFIVRTLVWPIFTYGCESWTMSKRQTERVQTFEHQCYRRALRISYVEHVTNEEVFARVGEEPLLLTIIKTRKLRYFGHTMRHPSLERDVMLGITQGIRRSGGPRRQWLDDITEWLDMNLVRCVRATEERDSYRELVRAVSQTRARGDGTI